MYGASGDGKVGLYTSKDGSLGVAKFILPKNTDSTDDEMKQWAEEEATRWQDIWDIHVPVVKMMGRSVLLMPFLYHIQYDYNRILLWCSLEDWESYKFWKPEKQFNPEKQFFKPTLISDDDALQNDSVLLDWMKCPLSAAKSALHHMIVERGWKLDDDEVSWRHVALMPSSSPVRPIIIDLTRCERIGSGVDRYEIYKNHVDILKSKMVEKYASCDCGCQEL